MSDNSGSFEQQTVPMSTILKWLGALTAVTAWLAWGFLVYRIDTVSGDLRSQEARIHNLEERVVWRHTNE